MVAAPAYDRRRHIPMFPQLTWSLTPHLRTGAFARAAAATLTTDPLARGALFAPSNRTDGAAYL